MFEDDQEAALKLNVPEPVPFSEQMKARTAGQAHMAREDIKQQMIEQSEAIFDPETATPPDHHWVERGLVMSCEGAGHPNHRHFKYKRA